jgi:branched-subunit amino acid transport protein
MFIGLLASSIKTNIVLRKSLMIFFSAILILLISTPFVSSNTGVLLAAIGGAFIGTVIKKTYVWTIILGGCLVTIIPRVIPITLLSKVTLNETLADFLTYLPISILSALIAAELLIVDNHIAFFENSIKLFATLPTLFIAIKKDNLLLTVLTGIITLAVLRLIV